jgi:hypothetical protein
MAFGYISGDFFHRKNYVLVFAKKVLATFWAIFSRTRPDTLPHGHALLKLFSDTAPGLPDFSCTIYQNDKNTPK